MKPQDQIEHVFVLMLENRSYDHVFGFSRVGDLKGDEFNQWKGQPFKVMPGADYVMPRDPGHSFTDVLEQLAGPDAAYTAGKPYPPITMSGFAANFGNYEPKAVSSIFNSFTPQQLPMLNFLAQNYSVCRRWFSPMPGPTWPNRFFVHAASSGGMDEMPSLNLLTFEYLVSGYRFDRGTIFNRLKDAGKKWTVWEGDEMPQSILLYGMIEENLKSELSGQPLFRDLTEFADAINDPGFDAAYNFIEPHYGYFFGTDPRGGNSMHPVEDVRSAEQLIRVVYEAVRRSPHWAKSLLIIVFDEHGGLYDHVPPPSAPPPGDLALHAALNRHGFDFSQLGVRVPCVVVSPWVAAGHVDETPRDHTSILKTVEEIFGLEPLTARDAWAPPLSDLFLDNPRTDAPPEAPQLPPPLPSSRGPIEQVIAAVEERLPRLPGLPAVPVLTPLAEAFVHVAARRHLQLERMGEQAAKDIMGRVQAIQSQGAASSYLEEVREKYQQHRSLRR